MLKKKKKNQPMFPRKTVQVAKFHNLNSIHNFLLCKKEITSVFSKFIIYRNLFLPNQTLEGEFDF